MIEAYISKIINKFHLDIHDLLHRVEIHKTKKYSINRLKMCPKMNLMQLNTLHLSLFSNIRL